MIPSLERWRTKAKEAPSPHEVRPTPLDTNPVFQRQPRHCHNVAVPAGKTLEKGVKYFTYFTPFSSVTIVDFERVNVTWVVINFSQ